MFRLENVGLRKLSGVKENQILSGINLSIPAHRITAIIGPSGAGKSSLLRMLNRLDEPTDGTVYFDNRPLNSYPVLALRRRVGMVFQIPVMFAGTVAENIQFAANHFNSEFPTVSPSQKPLPQNPIPFLEMVGLSAEIVAKNAELLSVGQQQRVALARTLANHPDVLLLDEPTASLDPASATGIMELIRRLRSQLGLTVVIVTHILEHAKNYSDFICFIHQGRLLESGTPTGFFANPETSEARTFIGGNGGLP